MKSLTIELTEKEFNKIKKIKLSDPQNIGHHSWSEFLIRIAKCYEKEL